ncbi:BlaI/MecI/CopY family transcriptional regulator [Caldicellulosiruptor changbaiensis]|uniref:BlaI/MecI/CopY family transcriptional regulator n=1 Tax=Caldicellulosiruptor changbaiensis TaxID=1222016 RepID=A0A3T0D7P0_9FIRM|nr:BlaI/MecI/CopY family transcriptional regulator [Caldicellulosiruptor changbaiensis]AZT91150.1 BlaI/MecI/CopY family transcriptional regulator [Caldicellulosiruptor changbaiensis]
MRKEKNIPQISEAEFLVMKVLWEKSPLTSPEIIEVLRPKTNWNPKTIHTLIGRLIKKGAIGADKNSFPKKLYPLVTEEQYRKEETKYFLQKLYNGSLKRLVANFVEDEQISKEELEEIKKLLEGKEEK